MNTVESNMKKASYFKGGALAFVTALLCLR